MEIRFGTIQTHDWIVPNLISMTAWIKFKSLISVVSGILIFTTKLVGLIHDLYFRPPQIEAGFLGKVHISPGDRFACTYPDNCSTSPLMDQSQNLTQI